MLLHKQQAEVLTPLFYSHNDFFLMKPFPDITIKTWSYLCFFKDIDLSGQRSVDQNDETIEAMRVVLLLTGRKTHRI